MTNQSDPLGFPIHALTNGVPMVGQPIHASVHKRVRTHLLGQRTEDGIWPPHSQVAGAVEAYGTAHAYLYESLDPVAAARLYEKATSLDEGYLQAWVGLALAWTSMGTPDSLESAIQLWQALVDLPVGDNGVSRRCMGILLQNLAYTLFQQHLYTHDLSTLKSAATYYQQASTMEDDIRPELYFPWCNVLMMLGQETDAGAIWRRAGLGTFGPVKDVYLDKYADLSALDLRWSK